LPRLLDEELLRGNDMENDVAQRPDQDSATAVMRQRLGLESAFHPDDDPSPGHGSRVLLVCALGTDPREARASNRLLGIARTAFETARVQTEVLNLSLAAAAQTDGRGLGLGARTPAPAGAPWAHGTVAHGVLILMPAHWRRASSALKLLMNRSAPAASSGAGSGEPAWSHQPYVGARTYGLVTHGDLRCPSRARHALCDWLDWMGLLDACEQTQLHHIAGDGEPHDERPPEWEVRCATAAMLRALAEIEAGRLYAPEHLLMRAWPQ
jgi:hypothetical protein